MTKTERKILERLATSRYNGRTDFAGVRELAAVEKLAAAGLVSFEITSTGYRSGRWGRWHHCPAGVVTETSDPLGPIEII